MAQSLALLVSVKSWMTAYPDTIRRREAKKVATGLPTNRALSSKHMMARTFAIAGDLAVGKATRTSPMGDQDFAYGKMPQDIPIFLEAKKEHAALH